jgi:hypothetical protein
VNLQRSCPRCGAQLPTGRSRCPDCGVSYRAARAEREGEREAVDSFAPEKAGIQAGVAGGLIMIVIAAVWFFVGYSSGRIFIYPPILAALGVFAIVKGLLDRNFTGERGSASRGASRRARGAYRRRR